jgi:hypothetical protein
LKPQAAEAVKKKGEMELGSMVSPTPTIQCWPEPVPYIFNGVAMQMLQQPGKNHFPLSQRPSGSLRSHEPASFVAGDAILVRGFRRPLRG